MPTTIEAIPQADFWQRMCKSRPLRALSEIVWNALDADAVRVVVTFARNPLGGIQSIVVTDNGTGIPHAGLGHQFSNLGGSWKARHGRTTKEKRILHGKNGEGRFRAFALGERVMWDTVTDLAGALRSYNIFGSALQPGKFLVSDTIDVHGATSGTSVNIDNLASGVDGALLATSFQDDFSRVFAPY